MTTENNKIIAEFIGAKLSLYNTKNYELYGVLECINDGEDEQHFFNLKEMKFPSDWNWLIEVIKECYTKEHHQNSYYEAIYYALADLNIEAVYNACLEFIKWYNE